MTQRQKVLRMLKDAGDNGVRSDEFFKAYIPRAGARVHELRAEGYEITSEQERQFVRYRLIAGVGVVTQRGSCSNPPSSENSGVDSGDASTGDRGQAAGHVTSSRQPVEAVSGAPARSVPNCFDADADWSAAA